MPTPTHVRWRVRKQVALYFARQLLAERPCWLRSEFAACWRRAVPEGLPLDETVLRGEVLPLAAAEGPSLKAFPAAALPREPSARFDALFAERPCWLWADLEPYVQGMQVGGGVRRGRVLCLAVCMHV